MHRGSTATFAVGTSIIGASVATASSSALVSRVMVSGAIPTTPITRPTTTRLITRTHTIRRPIQLIPQRIPAPLARPPPVRRTPSISRPCGRFRPSSSGAATRSAPSTVGLGRGQRRRSASTSVRTACPWMDDRPARCGITCSHIPQAEHRVSVSSDQEAERGAGTHCCVNSYARRAGACPLWSR
jgi:hypothetical protein